MLLFDREDIQAKESSQTNPLAAGSAPIALAGENDLSNLLSTPSAGSSAPAPNFQERELSFSQISLLPPLLSIGVDLLASSDSGISDSDNITNDNTPTFDVNFAGGLGGIAKVQVLSDGQVVGETTLSSPTRVTTSSLADGSHTITARALNVLGNSLAASAPLNVKIDTQNPSLSITAPIANWSHSKTARLIGSASDGGAGISTTRYSLDGGTSSSLTANASGAFDALIAPGGIASGNHNVAVSTSDIAGNQTSQTVNFQVTDNFLIKAAATQGWGAYTSDALKLEERNSWLTETAIPIELGFSEGTRTLQFQVQQKLDTADKTSAREDEFEVLLIDPNNTGRIFLDGSEPSKAIFCLAGSEANYTPGLVRYDGNTVSIDLSSLKQENNALVVFRTINNDTDTGSAVEVKNITNTVDPEGVASPVFPVQENYAPIGAALDISQLAQSTQVKVKLTDACLNSTTGQYTANLQVVNTGAAIGRNVAVSFPNLPAGVQLQNPSGFDAAGAPYVNFRNAIAPGGLNAGETSDAVKLIFTNPNFSVLPLKTAVFVGGANTAPALPPIGALTVLPGGRLEVPLGGSDADGESVTYSLKSSQTLPKGKITSDGTLIFTPTPDEVGTYTFTAAASDGALETQQEITLTVAPDPVTTTRISGVIQNTATQPLVGVVIELGSLTAVTDASGSFTIETPGALPSDTLKIRGEGISGSVVYPFIAEKLPLLLEHEPYQGVNNVISRPIYLPPIDTANAQTIDPNADIAVTTAAIPGASVFVKAGSLLNQQSSPYTGQLSITEVPTELTPAALPANLHPDLVVTIQPGEMVFTAPAPLSLPNRAGYDPGALMDLWSINPVTGFFDKVGIGKVSADGSVIETISGGIRNSSWHMFAPPPLPPEDPEKDPRNPDDGCEECKATCSFTSVAELHSGAVMETHELASYSSKGVSRTWKLTYDSLRADPRSILHFGYKGVPYNADDRLIADVKVSGGAFEYQVPGFASGQYGLRGGEHFWSIPQNGGALDAALALDLRSLPSGQYDYALTSGIRRFNGEIFAGSSTTSNGKLLSVNSINSPWGSGWGLAGLQELVENPNGSVLLIDGDGSELLFEASPLANGTYVAPPGDFSTLERLSDGTFRRTLTDKTVYQFNGQNKLISVTDRNSNQTQHVYDSAGRLQKIVDPVGLETTFTYTGEKITAITDPANRVTRLEYDAAGNLKRIADPDTTARTWEYDGEHRIIAEVDKRNNREQASYDFAGRAETAIRKDGSKVQVAPVAVQGLYRPEQTTDPFNAPVANALGEVESFETDGNGNVKAKTLDKTGQVVSALDGGGFLPSVKRDEQNLVTEQKNGRNNVTNYKYDPQTGKVLSISDELSGTGVPEGSSENLFGSGGEYETGFNPVSVAVGDINSDSIADIVTANVSGYSVSVLLGNGDGSFLPRTDVSLGFSPTDVELTDINSDGKLDIVTNNLISNSVAVLLGDGEGSFAAPVENSVGVGPLSVTVGDVNGDTWTDIITANTYDNTVSVLLASGNGGFNRVDTPVGVVPSSVASGYINADNLIDVVIGYASSHSPDEDRVSVLLGQSDGSFAPPTDYDVAFGCEFVALEDLDGDGALDIVTSNANLNNVSVLWSGAFGFTNSIEVPAGGGPAGVAFDDVNGDGANDILTANSYNNTVSVLLNNGDRTFTLKEDVPVGSGPFSAAVADLDLDGDKDLIAANPGNNNVSVRLKNTSGAGGGGRGERSYTYDPIFNQVTSETDELGRQTLYEIDTLTGNTLSVRRVMGEVDNPNSPDNPLDPDDVVTRYTYTANGLVDTETDPNGRVTDYDYDPQGKGRLVKVTFALGTPDEAVQQFEYDAAGNQTAMIDERGNRMEYKYDAMNRLERTTFAVGTSSEAVQRMEYDAVGNQTAMVDENGDRAEYQYDAMNQQTKTIEADPDGTGPLTSPVTSHTYDKSGNKVKVVDPLGRETQQRYDSRNRLVETINPDGSKERMRYDFDNNNTASFDANGNRTNMVYDARSRLIRQIDPLNKITTYEYNAANNLIALTDRNDHRTEFEYDGLNRQTKRINAKKDFSTTSYDAVGNVIAKTDELNRTTRYTYDARNRQTQVTDAKNGITTFTYDPAGNLTATTDPLIRTTSFTYDARNRQKTVTDPLLHTTNYTYDGVGNQLSMTDALGRKTQYVYDGLNRQTTTLDAFLKPTTASYDAVGNLTAITDPLGRRTQYTYNSRNWQTAIIDPLGNSTSTSYDANGNIVAVADALGHATRYGYDPLNRQTTVTDALNKTTIATYDNEGNIQSITDPEQNTTTYLYDELNRLLEETNQLGLKRAYTYDAVGNRLTAKDRNNRVRKFVYDELNRQTSEQWLDAAANPVRTINYTYDAASQIENASDPDSTYNYKYDKDGRLTDVDNAGTSGVPNVLLKYAYDNVNNLLSVNDTINGQAKGTESFTYDSLNRATRITQSGNGVASKRVDMGYDDASQLTGITRYSDLAGTQQVATSGYTYDRSGRLTQLTHSRAGTTLANYNWAYDAANRIAQFTSRDGSSSYSYDDRNQLTGTDHSFQNDEAYTYDDNGNRTNSGYQTVTNNQLQSDGTYNYQYDAEGNRTKRTKIATGEVTEYVWDYRNRLIQLVTKNSSGTPIQSAEYAYDVFDRRVAKKVDPDGAGTAGTSVERLVYDGEHIALTFDGSGNQTHRYLHGPSLDQILADESASGTVLWALSDNQGTVRDLVNSAGALQNHITYDSFGKVTSQTNAAVNFRFGYTGRELDSETGQYYYRARYYDASVGRFISEDPIGFGGGDANLYRYVDNSPVNFIDPSGNGPLGAAIGGAIGGIVGGIIGGAGGTLALPGGGTLGGGATGARIGIVIGAAIGHAIEEILAPEQEPAPSPYPEPLPEPASAARRRKPKPSPAPTPAPSPDPEPPPTPQPEPNVPLVPDPDECKKRSKQCKDKYPRYSLCSELKTPTLPFGGYIHKNQRAAEQELIRLRALVQLPAVNTIESQPKGDNATDAFKCKTDYDSERKHFNMFKTRTKISVGSIGACRCCPDDEPANVSLLPDFRYAVLNVKDDSGRKYYQISEFPPEAFPPVKK